MLVHRYVFKEIASVFGVAIVAFTTLLLTIKTIKLADLVVNKDLSILQVFTIFASLLPTFLEIALPLAGLLAAMLAASRLSRDSEIIVLRANGFSFFQLIIPAIFAGVLLSSLTLLVSNYLRPLGYQQLNATLFNIATTKSTSNLNANIFNDFGPFKFYAERIDDSLSNVFLEDTRNEAKLEIVVAKSGKIGQVAGLNLLEVQLFDGVMYEKSEKEYNTTKFSKNTVYIDPVNQSEDEGLRSREIPNQDLKYAIRSFEKILELPEFRLPDEPLLVRLMHGKPHLQEFGQKRLQGLLVEQQMRFSLPFGTLLLTVFGIPLGIFTPRQQKSWGTSIAVIFGILTFASYYALLTAGMGIAESGAVSPFVGAWGPNLVLLAALGVILYLFQTEKIAAISDVIRRSS